MFQPTERRHEASKILSRWREARSGAEKRLESDSLAAFNAHVCF
jgi:hypothetical protein